MAMEYVRDNGGAASYFQQEGRGIGIGIANKVAAYARQYDFVPPILVDVGIESIRLLTNNPVRSSASRRWTWTSRGPCPWPCPASNRTTSCNSIPSGRG